MWPGICDGGGWQRSFSTVGLAATAALLPIRLSTTKRENEQESKGVRGGFERLGFETLGAPPPRPPPSAIGRGSGKEQTETEGQKPDPAKANSSWWLGCKNGSNSQFLSV